MSEPTTLRGPREHQEEKAGLKSWWRCIPETAAAEDEDRAVAPLEAEIARLREALEEDSLEILRLVTEAADLRREIARLREALEAALLGLTSMEYGKAMTHGEIANVLRAALEEKP